MSEGRQQEIWRFDDSSAFLDYDESSEKEVKNGNRISVSRLESLVPLYNASQEDPTGLALLRLSRSLNNRIEECDEKILRNAKSSILGTQLHQLQYITQLFARSAFFDRLPDGTDFYSTFPFRSFEYTHSLARIMEIMENDPYYSIAENYWRAWRLNGHDFNPKNNGYRRITPLEIRVMWEEEELGNKIMNDFRKGSVNMKMDDINPERVMIINEGLIITNIDFGGRNMQFISYPDEIRIPKDLLISPVEIIDYKTGLQFRKPDEAEQLQILFTKFAVYANIIRNTEKLRFSQTAWEVVHERFRFPIMVNRKLQNPIRNYLSEEDLRVLWGDLDRLIKFSYVDPSTQRRMEITNSDLGIEMEGDYLKKIDYMRGLNDFYGVNKKFLSSLIKRGNNDYSLPSFPYKGFDKRGSGNLLKGGSLQPSLF